MIVKAYTMLTKPGIIFGNVLTTAAGFFLASKGVMEPLLLLNTIVGLIFVVGSACAFNNCYDRAIDSVMKRTQKRALVTGEISLTKALIFATFLGLSGIGFLAYFTNILTAFVGLVGFFVYLVPYAFWKYRSFYGTLVGSIAGAVPPVLGYTAVSNQFDLGAFLLFTIVFLWQMPHFFAIAIYRFDDYKAASIPVLPVEKGMYATKVQMFLYIIAFTFSVFLLSFAGYTGMFMVYLAALLGVAWLGLCWTGFNAKNDHVWAHQMFVFSLVAIMVFCFAIPFDTV